MKRTLRSQSDYQQTLLRNQLTSLVLYEAVTTTKAKAKKLIPFANRFFNQVKPADLAAKRLAHQLLFDKNAVKKTFDELLPRYDKAATAYLRSFHMAPRRGDSSPMTLVVFSKPLETKTEKPVKEAKPKTKTKAAKK